MTGSENGRRSRPFSKRLENGGIMNIYTYLSKESAGTFPKLLENKQTLQGNVRDILDIENPVIRIETSAINFNYVEIPDLHRFYFVIDAVAVRNNIFDITCAVDVLQSHYAQFVNSPCIVSRSENNWNSYIDDNSRKFYQYTSNQYITIGDLGAPEKIVIVTVG